ncbi:MAG: hypothetical protein ACLUQW_06420 [Collinsella sp.]
MASKNLLPVVALCGALATGTPVAAWATPIMADSLSAALSSAPNPSSAIACKRFSIAQAAISTSGCLRRNTDDSIVVDLNRSNKANGSQAGCAVCTWRSVVLDADGDPCNLELRIDIASVDDSANGAKVAFDGTFFEKGGGICLSCAANAGDAPAHPLIHGIVAADQAGTDAIRQGEATLLFYAVAQRHRRSFREASRITRPYEDRGVGSIKSMPTRKAGNAFLPRQRFSKWWNGSEPSEFSLRATPRRSHSNDNPSTQPEESADKEAGAGARRRRQRPPASFEAPNEPLPIRRSRAREQAGAC